MQLFGFAVGSGDDRPPLLGILAASPGAPDPLPEDMVPPKVVHEVAYYAKYFMGCYGLRITLFLHPLNGIWPGPGQQQQMG